MKTILIAAAMTASILTAQGLTKEQKELDFRHMVAIYNSSYAPLDWKKELFQFDALDLKPWLDKVAATKTDLEFYELCVDYVASLQDTHSGFILPSDFVARLGFSADIFDGKVLIDSISRISLPISRYPFGVGDEIVSVDGEDADTLVRRFQKYWPQGNERASRRFAANSIATRAQSRMPHAPQVGDEATVVVRRQNGDVETYKLPWIKTGTPLTVGPVPGFKTAAGARPAQTGLEPDYLRELEELQHSGVSAADVRNGVLNYGARNPIFLGGLTALPDSRFTRRLGGSGADFFYSGVFQHDGLRIGFLRIPSYAPPSQALALQQLDQEIAFFNANTDGLIIDQMRNTGGNLCFGESVMSRLTTREFQTTGFELRAFWWRTNTYYQLMMNAKNAAASPEIIEQWELLYQAMLEANRQSRGVTKPIPICASSILRQPATDALNQPTGYTKPIIMLIDEFSTSTGDSVPSMFQESGRGLLMGYRSNGAGGNNISVAAGPFTEALVGMTIGVQVKYSPVTVPGYPTTGWLENVGVHPEIPLDYMTKENLLQNGAPFVKEFLDRIAAYVRQNPPQP